MKKVIIATTLAVMLSACAGLSPSQIEMNKAVHAVHSLEAEVQRKEIRLALNTAASAAATKEVFETVADLKKTKKELKEAKIHLESLVLSK